MNDTEQTVVVSVSELLTLRIENAALKMAQYQELYVKTLTAQRASVEEARREVSAPNEWIYDIDTRAFKPGATS